MPEPSRSTFTRMEVWQHNSFLGHARMMMQNCRSIIASPTATEEAKDLARDIYAKAADLGCALRQKKAPSL